MDKEIFEDEIKQSREENVEYLVKEALKSMREYDIKLGDSPYVYNRTVQLIERTLERINFSNKEIEKLRRAFLDVLIDGIQKRMFTIKDEIKQAKKELKEICNPPAGAQVDQEAKKKVKEMLEILERVQAKQPKDSTEERYVECEPVCQHMAKKILSKEWLLKDDNYIKKAIEFDNELLIAASAYGCANSLFEKVGYALDMHYSNASEKFWGESKRKLRMSKLDNKLKE